MIILSSPQKLSPYLPCIVSPFRNFHLPSWEKQKKKVQAFQEEELGERTGGLSVIQLQFVMFGRVRLIATWDVAQILQKIKSIRSF